MSPHHTRRYLAAFWMSLALLAFSAADAWSGQSVLLLAVVGLVPPMIMMALWKTPPPTIAEVLHAAEERR